LKIIPSSNGVFEVKFDNELMFSKIKEGRFPTDVEMNEMTQNI